MSEYKQEGDVCGIDGCDGKLFYPDVKGCSCHISPPCSACTDNQLECKKCGEQPEE